MSGRCRTAARPEAVGRRRLLVAAGRGGLAAASAAGLSACGPLGRQLGGAVSGTGAPAVGSREVTLQFMYGGEPTVRDTHTAMSELFTQRNPQIKVEQQHAPAQYVDKIYNLAAADTLPDVFWAGASDMLDFADRGLLLPLKPLMRRDTLDTSDLYPRSLTQYQWKAEQYGLPRDWAARLLFYNVDAFRQAGVPRPAASFQDRSWTWETFLEAARKLTRSDGGEVSRYGADVQGGYYTAYIGKSHFYAHVAGEHLRDHEDYTRASGFGDVHETTGPQATVATDSYMADEWRRKGLLDLYREDYRKRWEYQQRSQDVAAWLSPLPVEDHLDSYIGRQSVAWLEHYDRPQPFLLWASFGGPHPPFDAPGEYATLYDPAAMPPAKPKPPIPAWAPAHVARFVDRDRVLAPETVGGFRASYAGKVSLVDPWFGRILEALERRGILDDTSILFTSDHGAMLSDHGLMAKSVSYEESVRVPLLMRHPRSLPQGVRVDNPVELIDGFPTLTEIGGAERSGRAFGQSLLPLARGETSQHKPIVFSEIDRRIMAFDGRFKYAVDAHARGLMLYDLETYPAETTNLIGHPDFRPQEQRLREAIFQWLVRTQVVMTWPPNSAASSARMSVREVAR